VAKIRREPTPNFDAEMIGAAAASYNFHLDYHEELIRGTNIA
jgi:hypothetical protein